MVHGPRGSEESLWLQIRHGKSSALIRPFSELRPVKALDDLCFTFTPPDTVRGGPPCEAAASSSPAAGDALVWEDKGIEPATFRFPDNRLYLLSR